MDLNEYQSQRQTLDGYEGLARRLVYEKTAEDLTIILTRLFHYIGLTGEVGELGEKIKKEIRDNDAMFEVRNMGRGKELGDIEWYLTALERDEGFGKEDILEMNMEKLESRKKRNLISGDGDNR